ncbi:MAG TPA: PspC domain-containing protein [Pseudonocardiaceae bacterium]
MSTTQRTSSLTFEDTFKDFVATRPRRPRGGRIIAGVAAGIGRRYGIDPIIVRVALVVSAFYGGAGVIVYLLGWLFLPAEGDEVSGFEGLIGRGRSGMSRAFAVVLCIALIPSGGFTFGGHLSTLAGLLALLGGLFLLHRYRSDQGIVDAPAGTTSGTDSEVGSMTDSTPTEALHPESGPQDRVPPAWDPLGAAPFAWDLPEPGPAAPPEPPLPVPARRRSRIGLATFGLALVIGAVLTVVGPAGGWLNAPHIVGILGAVIGIGLVAGSFVRGGRGLIPLAILLSGAGFLMTSAQFTTWRGAGNADFAPTSISDVQPVYQRSAGSLRLDLTHLPNTGTVRTQIKLGVGNATVFVPADADVVATCSANIGNVDCLDQRDNGAGHPSVSAHQTGSGLHIVLDVQDGTGSVRVINSAHPLPLVPVPAPVPPDVPGH